MQTSFIDEGKIGQIKWYIQPVLRRGSKRRSEPKLGHTQTAHRPRKNSERVEFYQMP